MSHLDSMAKNGYQLIYELFKTEEIAQLKAECDRLVTMFDPERDGHSVFNPDKGKNVLSEFFSNVYFFVC